MAENLRQRVAAWLRKWAERVGAKGDQAHTEVDSCHPDALKADVMRFLDAVDQHGDLPPGWSVGGVAGRKNERHG